MQATALFISAGLDQGQARSWTWLRVIVAVYHPNEWRRVQGLELGSRGNTETVGNEWRRRGEGQLASMLIAGHSNVHTVLGHVCRFFIQHPEMRASHSARLLREASQFR